MRTKHLSYFRNLGNDIPAGMVVFLVAVPLCLGIALASGAPLFSGIIAGIVGGTVVAFISRSPLGVSGPAAGLAVIVLTSIQSLGSFETFLLAVFIAGIFQMILGSLKAGIIAYYFPSSVIKGMLAGIGVIIILKQIPHAFGYDAVPEGDFAFFQSDGHTTFSDLTYMFDYISPGAIIISAISLIILLAWEGPFFKKYKIFHIIQGPLVVVITGIVLTLTFRSIPELAISTEHIVTIPVADSLAGFFGQFTFPDFGQLGNPAVYTIAMTIAVVASLETLLCVEATDKLDPHKRITPTSRELVAQGAGNMISGLVGGLPITQVIVRSSANIQSGGKTKASAIVHGVLLLLASLAIPAVLNMIPLASLAAILLVVGYKLAKPAIFISMFQKGKSQYIPFVVTILGIVFTDLLIGIALGMVVAVFYILWINYITPYEVDEKEYVEGKVLRIELAESVSFLNKAMIMNTLKHLPENSSVVVDASRTKNIHPDILEIIDDFSKNAETKNIKFKKTGFESISYKHPLKKFRKIVLEEEIPENINPKTVPLYTSEINKAS